ncbi:MAG: penicillin-binding protein activator [Pseudomonadota bacterium]|nr:penicillin-binding protein activator [Pseudomonadota bacterium]
MGFAIIAGIDSNCEFIMQSLLRTRWIHLTWLPLVAVVLIAGCVSAPQKPEPAAAQSAESAMAQGDLVFAAQEYERLAKTKRTLREHYILLAAEAWRDQGEFGEVRRVLTDIKRVRLSAEQNVQLDLLLAEALLLDGEFDQADVLLTIPEGNIKESDRTRFLELRAKALAGSGRTIDALNERHKLHALLPNAERSDNEAAVVALLSGAKPDLLHTELKSLDASDPRRPWLEKSLRARSLFPARATLRASRSVGAWQTDSEGQAHAEGFLDPGKIALLLPLSGEFASAGKAVRDGFFTAWFAARSTPQQEVRVYDSGGDRASLLLALEAAVRGGASTLVGPLERGQVEALFTNLPEDLRVLALNHPDMNPVPPRGQFQFGLSPEEEATLAAERLIDSGVRRSVVMVSQEDWAERAGKAFSAQFIALGGSVLGERAIAPAAIKFIDELDALLGKPNFELQPAPEPTLDALGNAVPAAKPRLLQTFRADAPEAMFVAIRSAHGRMLMPQLRVRGQDNLIVLATSHIATASNGVNADRDLEGISFLDAPFLYDSAAAVGLSRSQLGTQIPSAGSSARLFAFGIDACRLLPYLDYLSRNEGTYLEGATGQLLIDVFGRVRRLPGGYRFRNGLPVLSAELIAASGVRAEPALVAPEPAAAQ